MAAVLIGDPAVADVTIRKATADDVPVVAQTLARAFQSDPAFTWAFPDDRRRERVGPRYFDFLVRAIYLPKGEVHMTEDGGAAALWSRPEQWQVSIVSELPLLPLTVRAAGRYLLRTLTMPFFLERKHKRHLAPHYYLPIIGTAPAHQGSGYGGALLEYMLQRCDAEAAPAYLEATSARSRSLYARHGFEAVEELNWPWGGPPLWPMWRSPA